MFALDVKDPVRWYLSFNAYDKVHGEPGGLTLSDEPCTVNYGENRNATSRFFDRMRIQFCPALRLWASFTPKFKLTQTKDG